LLVGFVCLQFYVPRLYAARYAEYFRTAYAPGGRVEVKIKAFPFLELGSGRIDRLSLAATQVAVGGITLDTLTAELTAVHLTAGGQRGEEMVLQSVGDARVVVTAGEAALNAYLTANLPDLLDVDLRLHPDKVTLAGRVRFVGRLFTFFCEGNLVPAANNAVAFRVDTLTLEGVELPQLLTDSAQAVFDGFSFPLGQLGPLGQLTVTSVNVREGSVGIVLMQEV